MCSNYSANQFESSFRADRLRHWAGDYCVIQRPKTRKGTTEAIADSKGHLLPGVPRPKNQRGVVTQYKSTWQLPRKITRALANELGGRPMLTSWEKRSSHVPLSLPSGFMSRKNINKKIEKRNGCDSRNSSRVSSGKIKETELNKKTGEYVPGSIQEIHAKELASGINEQRLGDPYGIIDQERKIEKQVQDDLEEIKSEVSSREAAKCVPLASDYCDAQIAHKMHMENLKHQPLPDIVNDNGYKALAMQRQQMKHPATALSDSYMPHDHRTAAWRAHKPGPNTITKNKIIRPKTAVNNPPKEYLNDIRPHTSIPKTKHTPIELAICWEIEDKPRKPPRRLDNTSASQAPAVFAMVKPENEEASSDDFSLSTRKSSELNSIKSNIINKHSGSRKNSAQNSSYPMKNGPREAWGDINEQNNSSEKNEEAKLNRKTSLELSSIRSSTQKSRPSETSGLNGRARSCGACQLRKMSPTRSTSSQKEEFKQAFLAGKPGTRERSSSSANSSNQIKVPKPKTPYAQRSYSIDTLAPPFSLWSQNKGQGYPEHWRLSSVYQHSFKPPELRKKSLLNSVFQ